MSNEQVFKDYLADCVEKLKLYMDDTFHKYISGNLPPQIVTDEKEQASILAGMGLVDYEYCNKRGLVMQAKKPYSIFWNGTKFEISVTNEEVKK